MKRIQTEADVLDESFRVQVIKEMINCPENLERKASALRRHEIYRDKNKKWVMQALSQEGYKPNTLHQMENRATNISIAKKITNKLAQTYIGGVQRNVKTDKDQESIDQLADELDFNTKLKKADRYRQLFKNSLVGVMPVLDTIHKTRTGNDRYSLDLRVFAPWQYDVVEDPNDKTKPLAIIFTDFVERDRYDAPEMNYAEAAQGYRTSGQPRQSGDGKNQTIADDPADEGTEERTFIWWTPTYHLTCDEKGKVIPDITPKDFKNPIQTLPMIDIHDDQDGSYWAQGGDDVVEGSILINKELTDVNYIAFVQGWGQLVITGRNLPKVIEGGPDNAIMLEQDGDVAGNVFYASSNPNLTAWLENVRMTLALLLSTNNLSTRNIAAKLDIASAPSGIAMMIENSEVMTETKDHQVLFQDKEPLIWEVIRRWHTLYADSSSLVDKFQQIAVFKDSDVDLKFHSVKPPVSPKESLEELKMRKDIGLDSLVDSLMRDNPDLTQEEAEAKAVELKDEKQTNAAAFGLPGKPPGEAGEEDKEDLEPTDDEEEDKETEDDEDI